MSKSIPQSYFSRIWRAIVEFDLLAADDKILIGLSGGKDSMFLTYALSIIQKHAPFKFELAAFTVDPLFTDDFDAAYGKISSLILGIGFVQETNINTDRVYIDNVLKLVKNGTIVLRVDRSKFDKVLNGLKEIGAVTNWSIQGEDVTEKYYDTESRLKLLRLEEERVIEYLKKITDPDKIEGS
jgi:tRNA(Ile)-lysidine synthase TilS/MesJ